MPGRKYRCASAGVHAVGASRRRSAFRHAPPAGILADRHPAIGFEENRGQASEPVEFVWRGGGGTVFLTPSEAVTTLDSGDTVNMRFDNAGSNVRIEGRAALPGRSNYLVGQDQSEWVNDVSRYDAVRYTALYPGIDLIFYEGDALEYDFVVAPGARTSDISLDFGPSSKVTVDRDGALVIATRHGDLHHRAPLAYQDSESGRRAISCRFAIRRNGHVGFDLGAHDSGLPLVIDPQIQVSSYLGGSAADRIEAMTLDASGNIYLTGRTFSADFPVAGAAFNSNSGNYDVFVTKLDPTATTVIYSTYIGGSDFDSGQGIGVTTTGEVYVGGYTGSTDFPLTSAFQPTIGAGIDGCVSELNADGDTLLFSSYLGGNTTDEILGVAVSPTGDLYMAGLTNSTDLATTGGSIQPVYGGGAHDAFYARISGLALATLSYLGGSNDDSANGIALDTSSNVYITGSAGATFPVVTPFQATAGGIDAFVTKIDSSLSTIAYSSFLGGTNTDIGTAIAVDPNGNAYVTGYTLSSNFPTTTPFQSTNHGINDGFVTKVNAAGTSKVFSSYLGGTADDRANGITVDQWGAATVVGQTRSTDFPTLFPTQAANGGSGLNDIFATKVSASGRILVYSTYIGGSGTDVGYAVVVNSTGVAFVGGYTSSANYPTVTALQTTNHGTDDAVFTAIVERGDTPGIVGAGTTSCVPSELEHARRRRRRVRLRILEHPRTPGRRLERRWNRHARRLRQDHGFLLPEEYQHGRPRKPDVCLRCAECVPAYRRRLEWQWNRHHRYLRRVDRCLFPPQHELEWYRQHRVLLRRRRPRLHGGRRRLER